MTGLQAYMDRAVGVLAKYNIVAREGEESQMAALLQDVVKVDEPKVLAIGHTLKHMGTFNQLVRENIEGMSIADRYNDITKMFDSIRDDSKTLVDQLSDGKIDWKEGVSQWWMKVRRGTPHQRFEKIRETYLDVTKDTQEHLQREDEILNAYMDFRGAVKEAEILAYEVLQVQTTVRSETEQKFRDAVTVVQGYQGGIQSEKSRLELSRDEAQRIFQAEDRKFQLIKDVAENLTVGYNVGETLITKLQQTHGVKDQVYRRSVTFFGTNEHVFTVMDAVYTSQHGLHEATQTLNAMKQGAEKGLEDIAALAGNLEKAAIQAGYGESISAVSVQKLVDAIVSFQTESVGLIAQARESATANAKEVQRVVEEGKEKYRAALEGFVKPAALPPASP